MNRQQRRAARFGLSRDEQKAREMRYKRRQYRKGMQGLAAFRTTARFVATGVLKMGGAS